MFGVAATRPNKHNTLPTLTHWRPQTFPGLLRLPLLYENIRVLLNACVETNEVTKGESVESYKNVARNEDVKRC